MKLDVVVPTYNRADGLKQTLDSLLRAPIPDTDHADTNTCVHHSPSDFRHHPQAIVHRRVIIGVRSPPANRLTVLMGLPIRPFSSS